MAEPREYPDGIPGSREGGPAEIPGGAAQPAQGESIYRPLDGTPPRWPAFQPAAPGASADAAAAPAAAEVAQAYEQGAATAQRTLVLAGWGRRLAAVIIDNVITLAAVLCVTIPAGVALGLTVPEAFAFFAGFQDPGTIADLTPLYAVLAAQAIAQPSLVAWLLVRGAGQTPGKRLLAIRVVREDGGVPTLAVALLREVAVKTLLVGVLVPVTIGLSFLLNYLWPLWDSQRRAGHDLVARTRVIAAASEPGSEE